jgi:hypothetical protein
MSRLQVDTPFSQHLNTNNGEVTDMVSNKHTKLHDWLKNITPVKINKWQTRKHMKLPSKDTIKKVP